MSNPNRRLTGATDPVAIDPIVEVVGFKLSTATILFHAAVADRLGLNVTDVKCYSLVRQRGPLTAGELAELTGLTTGAITGVVDRLEKAGVVHRVRDVSDRRRVILEVVHKPAHEQMLQALYGPMGGAISQLVESYNAEDRATILDFLTKATDILEKSTSELRQGAGKL